MEIDIKKQLVETLNTAKGISEVLHKNDFANIEELENNINDHKLEKEYHNFINRNKSEVWNILLAKGHKLVEDLLYQEVPPTGSTTKRLHMDLYPLHISPNNPEEAIKYYNELLSHSPWKGKLKVVKDE